MKRYKVWKDGRIVESDVPGRYCGIRTQKIFGRLDCPSGKRKAHAKNWIFFLAWDDAVVAGYRPCKICKPKPDDS